MEDNVVQGCKHRLAIFHKHVKEFRGGYEVESPRVSVPVDDIRTISESHIDGTTLIRTADGGTIAVEEDFETANKIWQES